MVSSPETPPSGRAISGAVSQIPHATVPETLPQTLPERAALISQRLHSLHRSMDVYWGNQTRLDAMAKLYAQFVQPGDLAFDIGAHVGDRSGVFRRLGAQVVAVEPQADCQRILADLFAGDTEAVTLVEAICGGEDGSATLHVNMANATVATASQAFISAATGAPGWEDQTWQITQPVASVTLDTLIATFGSPKFVKIDVEGFEADVLAGLSQPVPALSFEFTTIQRNVVDACLKRLTSLGHYHFNYALGETQTLVLADWVDAAQLAAAIEALPHTANSGDVYAVLEDER